jgi:hypothetical protein
MKRIVSVSLGSSRRNSKATTKVLGEEVVVERMGVDGGLDRAVALIRQLDGQVDAFGLGGIDLYVYAGGRRYTFRDARHLAAAAVKSPVVDGSGLKNSLERRAVQWINQDLVPLKGKKVLLVSAVDRFGMAEALVGTGAEIVFGDLMFGLGMGVPLRRLCTVATLGRLFLPIVTRLPFSWVYPTGEKQNVRVPRWKNYYQWADVIAGDWLYIGRHLPDRLDGKVILTNTVTREDVEELRQRGAALLATTTPGLGGRSFGTNLMEGLIVAVAGKKPGEMTPSDYETWLDRIGFTPRIERFGEAAAGRSPEPRGGRR